MSVFSPVESLANLRHEFGEHGGVNFCIEASTTFTVLAADTLPSLFHGQLGPAQGCYLYGRHFNPTVHALGAQLAAIESAEAAYGTSSGMGAIAAVAMQLCNHGDHAVVGNTIYGGSFALFRHYLPRVGGVSTSFVDVSDLAAVEAAFTPRTRMLYVETVSNPTLVVADLPALAGIAHRHGAQLVVDNTFCPLLVTPIRHGADIVVHSLTKFASGGSDVIAGAVCGRQALLNDLMDVNNGGLMLLGPTMDPRVAFELSLRLPHLPLRVAEHARRAQAFAERLAQRGLRVIYPGLPDHSQHELLRRLANPGFGFGGMLALALPEVETANRLMEALQNQEHFGYIAVSLGYFDTLMSVSAHSTSSELSEQEQRRAGIAPGLVRIAIGYTGTLEQRWEQMERALSSVAL